MEILIQDVIIVVDNLEGGEERVGPVTEMGSCKGFIEVGGRISFTG